MPTYAILGATGSTGGSILRILAGSEGNQINVLVRSRLKLENQNPEVAHSPKVRIFEADISNAEVLAKCLQGSNAVFLTVAVNDNIAHTHIARDTARAVVAALQRVRSENPGLPMPRLVVLSSAAIDEHLMRNVNWIVKYITFTGHYWIYKDLMEAENILRSNSDWLNSTYVKPCGLVHDTRQGHALSNEHCQMWQFLSYLDLAAGMIEIAQSQADAWVQQSVSILPTAESVAFEWRAPIKMMKGFCVTYFPSLSNLLY